MRHEGAVHQGACTLLTCGKLDQFTIVLAWRGIADSEGGSKDLDKFHQISQFDGYMALQNLNINQKIRMIKMYFIPYFTIALAMVT